ncbi:hypothetical protein QZH41_010470, partial [Actinostola sp. cb2023]
MVFVPSTSSLFKVLMYVAMACGFMFNLIEVVLLVDFVHRWYDLCVTKTEDESTKKCWNMVLLFSTLVMYLSAIICAAILYVMFTSNSKCTTNKFFIIFILCHCLVACGLSMLPVVKRAQSNTSSLQSAVVTLFAVLLTWTAVSHEPHNGCTNEKASSLDTGLSVQAVINTVVVLVLLLYGSLSSSQARLKQ